MIRRLGRSSLAIVLLAVVFTLAAPVGGFWDTASSADVHVTIYRDEYGVPHIYGDTAEATAYGFGYAQAQDHIQAMRKDFYTATGRMAEFGFGSSYVNSDRNMRLLHQSQTAAATYAALSPDHRACIDAFVAGINLYIDENAGSLPSWVLPVQPEEVLAWMHFGSISEEYQTANSELQALSAAAPAVDPMSAEYGSNMWTVGPDKSTIGVPILHGDPHLPWTGWTQWYEAHLSFPGVNVAGATFFGYPAIATGANDHMAWSMTDNSPDTADVYIETLNPSDPSQYLHDGEWLEMESETVTVKVAGQSDRVFTNYYTRHGPVIGEDSGVVYAAAMSTFENAPSNVAIFGLNAAPSIAAAFQDSNVPDTMKWNIIVADDGGNIFYLWNSRVAHKSEAYNWRAPVDGSTSATDWGPFLTVGELPHSLNPSQHYFQNANNPPWSTAWEIDNEDYPSYLAQGHWLGDRGMRTVEMLEAQTAFSIDEIKTTGLDDLSVHARALTPLLLEAWEDLGSTWPDPNGRDAAAIDLINPINGLWDYGSRVDSPVIALFRLWVDDFYALGPSFPKDTTRVPPPGSVSQADQEKMLTALDQATSFMMSNFGRLDPAWGDVHKMKRGSYVFPVAGAGSLPSPRMTSISSFSNGVWWATSGSSYVFVAAMTDPVELWSVRPVGESEDPASPHYADMSALYSANQYKRTWMTLSDVLAHQESAITLTYDSPIPVGGVAELPDGAASADSDSGIPTSAYAFVLVLSAFTAGAIVWRVGRCGVCGARPPASG